MKKIFLLLILVSSFVFATIDEYKTDIYFGNGILTSPRQAFDNAENVLKPALIETLGLKAFQERIGKVDYAYNDTFGFDQDIFESALQITNLSDYVDWWTKKLYENKQSVHEANIKAQVDKYEASIRAGHRVLVVAHSQGNLFAQEAYEKLGERSATHEKWLQKYWEAISIASPDPYSDIKQNMPPRIGWDNDVVAWLGRGFNHNGIECDVRHITWEEKAHLVGDPIPQKPNQPYLYKSQIPSTYKNFWTATEGWRDKLDSNVHAFTFYMGLPIKEGDEKSPRYKEVYKNWYTGKVLTDDAAKILIMDQIKTQLDKLEKLPSQWVPGPVCFGYANLKHRYASKEFETIKGVPIASKNGKLFDDGSGYVYAEYGQEVDRSQFVPDESLMPKKGIITVQLTWSNPDIDMNLDVRMPFGEKDMENMCLPIEHYVVEKESDVKEGVYNVHVTHSGEVNNTQLPQTVRLLIVTPDEAMEFDFNITSADALDIGHVADIVIEGKKVAVSIAPPRGYGVPPKVTHHTTGKSSFAKKANEYMYEIISRLRQGLLGPLSDAKIQIFDLNDTNLPLYKTRTTGGNSILTAGILNISKDFLKTLDEESYYLISVSGGRDIDTDDDGKTDEMPTENNGTIRAVIKGHTLAKESFRVTVLSEAVYQLIKDRLSLDGSLKRIESEMDELAARLLGDDVNGDSIITYADVLYWSPLYDKEKLLKNYNSLYMPIVQKIYSDEDIYDDVYALAYGIFLNDQTLHVKENAAADTVVGEVKISLHEGDAVFKLDGNGSENFMIDSRGVVTVAPGAILDYEKNQTYLLDLSAEVNGTKLSSTLTIEIDDVPDAPNLYGFASYIDENSPEGMFVGRLYIEDGLSAVTDIWLEGPGSGYFRVDNNGVVTVAPDAVLDYERARSFTIAAVAKNSHGESRPAKIYIYLNDLAEPPVIFIPEGGYLFSVDENIVPGHIVGTLTIIENKSPITSITIEGGEGIFSADRYGNIFLTPQRYLDYEENSLYILKATATNGYGSGPEATVKIIVNDIIDTPPIIENPLNTTVEESLEPGSLIGNIATYGAKRIVLEGEGAENFHIEPNGDIYLSESGTLDHESRTVYHLSATAYNDFGTSKSQSVTIYIKDVPDSPPIVKPANVTVDQNSSAGTMIGKVKIDDDGSRLISIEISGPGASSFTIDTKGYIYVSNSPQLDYSLNKQYRLSVKATNAFGTGKEAPLIVDVTKATPKPVGYYETSGQAESVAISPDGKKLYVGTSTGAIDIFNLSDGRILYGQNTAYRSRGALKKLLLSSDGTLLFALSENGSIDIVRIDTNSTLQRATLYTSYSDIKDFTISPDGEYLYGAIDGMEGGGVVQIIDIGDPSSPALVADIYATSPEGLALSSDASLLLLSDHGAMKIFTLQQGQNAVLTSSMDQIGYGGDIVISAEDTKAYISTNNVPTEEYTAVIANISSIEHPTVVGQFKTKSYIEKILSDQSERILYLSTRNALIAIDISDPSTPVLAGVYNLDEALKEMAIGPNGKKLYAASGANGLVVFDISKFGE